VAYHAINTAKGANLERFMSNNGFLALEAVETLDD
jgi:hypothetical protein